MSHQAILQKMDECATNHDLKFKEWIGSLVEYLNGWLLDHELSTNNFLFAISFLAKENACAASEEENTNPIVVPCSVQLLPVHIPSTVQVIADNIDLRQNPTHQTLHRSGKVHHWFHFVGMKDRVVSEDISQIQPKAVLSSLDITTFLPTVQDSLALNGDFTVLIARVLTHRLPAFEVLQGAVPEHIKHKYSKEMKMKSEVVSNFRLHMENMFICSY